MDRFETITGDRLCFLCLKESNSFCDDCSLPYCSSSHLKVHKNGDQCYPFRVLQKPEVGRYVVATRDLEPLDLILEDFPAVFGPNHDSPPACLECLLPVDGSFLCPECSLPLCGPDCVGGPYHKSECRVFQELPSGFKMRVKFDREIPSGCSRFIAPEYGCITPLRALTLKKSDPELWDRLKLLMDHDEDRRKETEYQKMFQVNVVDFLIKVCGLDFSEDEIFWVIGILRTNAFYIDDPQIVYPKFFRPDFYSKDSIQATSIQIIEDCVEPKTQKLILRAQQPIRSGEEITIQYISFMYGNLRRKKDIRSYWFFDCKCNRCLDPTEMGSLLSAVKCSDCETGDLLPSDSIDLESDWICSQCNHRQAALSVEDYIKDCEIKLHDTYEHNIEKYEILLEEFLSRLHPNHYLVMTVKKYLTDLYGYLPGYQYNQLTKDKIEQKIRFCKEFIETLGLVDPGCTKWRGALLYELHRPLLINVNQMYSTGQLPKDEFLETLKLIESYLDESFKCLKTEPEGTKESSIAKLAQKALTQTREIILFSDFL